MSTTIYGWWPLSMHVRSKWGCVSSIFHGIPLVHRGNVSVANFLQPFISRYWSSSLWLIGKYDFDDLSHRNIQSIPIFAVKDPSWKCLSCYENDCHSKAPSFQFIIVFHLIYICCWIIRKCYYFIRIREKNFKGNWALDSAECIILMVPEPSY